MKCSSFNLRSLIQLSEVKQSIIWVQIYNMRGRMACKLDRLIWFFSLIQFPWLIYLYIGTLLIGLNQISLLRETRQIKFFPFLRKIGRNGPTIMVNLWIGFMNCVINCCIVRYLQVFRQYCYIEKRNALWGQYFFLM
jgi:hypothetical protein